MTDYAARRTTMVDTQIRPSDVTKFPIIDAMLNVAREAFVLTAQREAAYVGGDISLGGGRVVLDPRVFAKMLDALDIQPIDLVLDLGCGLGYSSAVISRLCEAVVAVENVGVLAAEAQETLSNQGADNVAVVEGELGNGAAKHGPYDVIVVQGGVETLPTAIVEQLKDGGRVAAIFMEGPLGVCRIGHNSGGKITWRDAFDATAPLLNGFKREVEFSL